MKIPIINSKKIGIIVGAVAALALSYGAGRYSRPAKTLEMDHTAKTEQKDSGGTTAKTEQAKVKTEQKDKVHVAKHKVTTKKPDGSVVITEDTTTDKGGEKDTIAESTGGEISEHHESDKVQETHDHSKLVVNFRPQWLISAYVGGVPSEVFAAAPKFMEGVSIEKQIIGPLYGGVWAMNIGSIHDPKLAGGVKASVLF